MENKIKIIIHDPYPNSTKAWRSIRESLYNAANSLGYDAKIVSSNKELVYLIKEECYLICSSGRLSYLKLKQIKNELIYYAILKKSLRVFTHLAASNNIGSLRLFEEPNFKINSNRFIFFEKITYKFYINTNVNDKRYIKILENIKKPVHELYLGGDDTNYYYEYSDQYRKDAIFIGTAIGERKKFFDKLKNELSKNGFNLVILGQDWSLFEKIKSFLLNICTMMGIKIKIRNKLTFSDERKYYSSSIICINHHEKYQVESGYDINERFFKIELCNGVQVTNKMAFIEKNIPKDFQPFQYENFNDCLEICLRLLNNKDNIKNRESFLYYKNNHTWNIRLKELIE